MPDFLCLTKTIEAKAQGKLKQNIQANDPIENESEDQDILDITLASRPWKTAPEKSEEELEDGDSDYGSDDETYD